MRRVGDDTLVRVFYTSVEKQSARARRGSMAPLVRKSETQKTFSRKLIACGALQSESTAK
jgi:hypothetical protein